MSTMDELFAKAYAHAVFDPLQDELDINPDPGREVTIRINQEGILYINNLMIGSVEESPVFLLHACSAAGKYGSPLPDSETQRQAAKYADRTAGISPFTVRKLFMRGMETQDPCRFVQWLAHLEILQHICPPLEDARWCMEHGNVKNDGTWFSTFDHCCLSLNAMAEFTTDVNLRIAALFHDIGKPKCADYAVQESPTFHGHDAGGALLAAQWLDKFGAEKIDIQRVYDLISNHMFYFPKGTTDRAIRNWILKTGDKWKDLILLRLADRKGNPNKQGFPVVTKEMKNLLKRIYTLRKSGKLFFKEDLAVSDDELDKAGLTDPSKRARARKDITGILMQNLKRNNKAFLLSYIHKLPYRYKK
jgi:tRNA nucleotidyltransferase (CCA-adding enzyme)